jgi:diguanylate cyclase (GGDEF)-like protein
MAGDLVLIQLSKFFTGSLRNFDLVARHTGEKFIFCLPETDEQTAKEVLARLIQSLEQNSYEITADEKIKMKFNYGISSINEARDVEQAVELAEQDLASRSSIPSP